MSLGNAVGGRVATGAYEPTRVQATIQLALTMPRDGAIIFRDLVGKLEVLRLECDKCGRFGRYHLEHLIEQYGIDAKLFDLEPDAECPRKVARNQYDPCGARCPDLAKVV